ncbi:MAG: hypothetical protein U9R15_14515, partial [Chloroflexota bacterium]|nr:hypothetical protein [Chloroflexota bacterium]
MLDELCDRITTYLAQRQVCIISVAGPAGARAMPVRYRSRGLEVDCLLPRWADVAYYLEQDPHVTLVIQDTSACGEQGRTRPGSRWLRCLGTARPVAQPDWDALLPNEAHIPTPDELY